MTPDDANTDFPCLEHFAGTTGFAPDALVEAFGIEKVFHEAITNESDFETRQALYKEVYETVHAIYGGRESVEIFRQEANPKEHTVWLFGKELAGKSVLDVGCGDGALLVEIDRRLEHGALAGMDAVVPPSDGGIGIDFLQSDIVKFETEDKFDLVFSDNVIEHIAPSDLDFHLASIRDALLDNGTLVVLTPNRLFGPWDVTRILDDNYVNAVPACGTHVNEMDHAELVRALKRHGFGRFRSVWPTAKITRRWRNFRPPTGLMVLAEKLPGIIPLLRRKREKWRILPAFEMSVVCSKV
jgi:2-polyprenyl-3-methyl-5-hydroxy-6-metoxy-1,4-benzoquinol methylase